MVEVSVLASAMSFCQIIWEDFLDIRFSKLVGYITVCCVFSIFEMICSAAIQHLFVCFVGLLVVLVPAYVKVLRVSWLRGRTGHYKTRRDFCKPGKVHDVVWYNWLICAASYLGLVSPFRATYTYTY